jgi:hypothetical protein
MYIFIFFFASSLVVTLTNFYILTSCHIICSVNLNIFFYSYCSFTIDHTHSVITELVFSLNANQGSSVFYFKSLKGSKCLKGTNESDPSVTANTKYVITQIGVSKGKEKNVLFCRW